MRSLLIPLVFAVACSSAPPPAQAPARPAPAPASTVDAGHLATAVDRYVAAIGEGWGDGYRFSGYIHVADDRGVLYSRGFGVANTATGAANTADTSFRIGSVTKQFTAAAIMLLVSDGKLAVSDPIGKHLPGYPKPAADQVTIHHLLTHTGGIPNYTNDEAVMAKRAQPHTVAELIATFQDQPLEFAPGEKFAYSNSGYILLGAIIEAASGQSYADFLRERLFTPAGLTSTVVGDAPAARDRAEGYSTNDDGAVEPAEAIDMSVPFAAGAVRSTATDLVRWSQALAANRVVSAADQELMYTPSPPSMRNSGGYGYGWAVVEGKHRVVMHDGGIDGFLTSYVRVPKLGLVVVVWTNNPIVDVGPIREAVVMAAFGGDPEPPSKNKAAALDPTFAARIAGDYAIDDASRARLKELGAPDEALKAIEVMTIRVIGAGLELDPIGQPAVPLFVKDETTLFTRTPAVELSLDIASGANASGFTLAQGGVELTYLRKP